MQLPEEGWRWCIDLCMAIYRPRNTKRGIYFGLGDKRRVATGRTNIEHPQSLA